MMTTRSEPGGRPETPLLLLPLPPGEGRGEGSGKHRTRTKHARALRRNATPAEQKLWPALRNQELGGAKFRRHYPCGPYILDYAAVGARLVIEVDGESHAVGDGPARDARRDDWLAAEGWRVLRFTNREVLGNLDGVLQVIGAVLAERLPHPGPLPKREGEAA